MSEVKQYSIDGRLEKVSSPDTFFSPQNGQYQSSTTTAVTGRRLSNIQAVKSVEVGGEAEIDAELDELGSRSRALKKPWLVPHIFNEFLKPELKTALVGFASMGGLLSGIDKSLISGANLFLPTDLRLNAQQSSLVSSSVPLGAVGGALLLGPLNELVGRRMAIIWSLVLYMIDAGLEAGAIDFGMIVSGRLILGLRENSPAGRKRFVWLDFFTNPRARRAIIYANTTVFLGQFTGINAIQYYMATLMNQTGFFKQQSVYMSLVGGGSLLLGTIPAIFYMERFGRRFWANAMLPIFFFFGLVLIGASYQINSATNLSAAEDLYITGLIIYEGFFGCYSCLTWVIPSEVYPTYLRSAHAGFYGGIAVIGWFYQILFMPATRNKTLEEIDVLFSQPTSELVRENYRASKKVAHDFVKFRWKRGFPPDREAEVPIKHDDLIKNAPVA